MGNKIYLPGLNALRFFAAAFVMISHASVLSPFKGADMAILSRGEDAVNFFFTLSGFLITYLLLMEKSSTGNISVKRFYLRRIFRIWPLYYVIVAIGFLLFSLVYPVVYREPYFNFDPVHGLMFFVFFLPNYFAMNFQVGLLYPLWSIGVEEQFYLFWAPLVKKFYKKVVVFLVAFCILTTVFYTMVSYRAFDIPTHINNFLLSLKFFEMAIGSLFALLLFKWKDLYAGSIFSSKISQALVLMIILWHYLIGFQFSHELWFKILCSFLYGLLILNVSVISGKLVKLDHPVLNYLGVISYGLYMYHLLVDYALRGFITPLKSKAPEYMLVGGYMLVFFGGTILVAGLSYRFFESRFLRMKAKANF